MANTQTRCTFRWTAGGRQASRGRQGAKKEGGCEDGREGAMEGGGRRGNKRRDGGR